jgi:hypothetical protein
MVAGVVAIAALIWSVWLVGNHAARFGPRVGGEGEG